MSALSFKLLHPSYFIDKICFSEYKDNQNYLVEYKDGMDVIFVSHQWQSQDDPDPLGLQFTTLREKMLIRTGQTARSQVRILKHSTEGGSFNIFIKFVDGRIVSIGCDKDDTIEVVITKLCSIVNLDMSVNKVVFADKELDIDLKTLADYNIQKESTLDIVPKNGVRMKQTFNYVWYDYACLPQKPRTADDQRLFDWTLANLEVLIAKSAEFVILQPDGGYFTRGWCVYETLLYVRTICSTSSDVISQRFIETQIQSVMEGKKPKFHFSRMRELYMYIGENSRFIISDVESALKEFNFKCTNGSDLRYLVKRSFCVLSDLVSKIIDDCT